MMMIPVPPGQKISFEYVLIRSRTLLFEFLFQNISGAKTGRVYGYQLFGHPRIRYPFALHTGNVNDSIVVRLLSWPTQDEFDRKIIEADLIEGDDYERRTVEVEVANQSPQLAYIYVSKLARLDEQWKPIRNGNWLERDPFLSV